MTTKVNELVKYAPYIKYYGDYGAIYYKPLKPTGRWTIESGPYFTMKMFVEHKGLVFKHMISEDEIVFRPESTVAVFKCN